MPSNKNIAWQIIYDVTVHYFTREGVSFLCRLLEHIVDSQVEKCHILEFGSVSYFLL